MSDEIKELNLDQDLSIDPDSLDVEWLRQPRLFMKWSEMFADASNELEDAKMKLEVTRAEVDAAIRLNPEEFMGNVKVTEGSISATILTHKDYQAVNQEYLRLRYRADLLKKAVSAMEQKRDALENLVKLHGQNYFAGPSSPRDLKGEFSRRESLSKSLDQKTKENLSAPKRGSKK